MVALTTIASVWSLGVGAGLPILHDVSPAAATTSVDAPAVSVSDRVPAMLDTISQLKPTKVSSYVEQNRSAIERTLSSVGSARGVVDWWAGLSGVERGLLSRDAASVLGNLDGLPVSVRDKVNRAQLTSRLTSLSGKANDHPAAITTAQTVELAGLRSINAALRSEPGGPKRSLVTFDPTGSARAAIVIGDLDRADAVSVLVPGMSYTVEGQLVDWASTAQAVYDEQRAWLRRLGTPSRTVATVAWIGYKTPDLGTVLSAHDAQAGAQELDQLLAGIRALRSGHQPYLSVLAHSYGSTTALLALSTGTVGVDALAVVGSPGSPAASVVDLDVKGGNVYVGSAAFDPIAGIGYFGPDPGSSAFGAHRINVGAGIDPVDGHILLPALGHNGYFALGTQSLRNLALVGMGEGALTTRP
ncbi:alpha/beta hydrolase [Rathayibacter soli]|uniref:alpha/beta hydrolase n=1 Tax=Rathayibacter soli TaxID=3144168 RepID=UPI0027E44B04|nr:alpha/beta hydrolase [Glaciibacter superstes]